MDMHKSHHHQQQQQQQQIKGKKSRKSGGGKKPGEKDVMKVVYISTPMKVKTTASNFREIVQELTGRQSDVVRIMESIGERDTWMVPDHDDVHGITIDGVPLVNHDPDSHNRSSTSPSSSEELIHHEPFDGVFVRGQESFGPLDSNFLYDQFWRQLDVLGDY